MRNINEIFVHCSATKPNWMEKSNCIDKVEEIRRWHVEERGWADIGYHFVLDRNGVVCPGRPVEKAGAHAKGHNKNSIGICIVGGFGSDANDKFEEHYTEKQRKALNTLLDSLTAEYSGAIIRGHNEVSSKACPGFNVKDYLNDRSSLTEEAKDLEEGSGSPIVGSPSIADLLMGLLRKLLSR
jgi:hypothetical protein